MVDLHIHSNLSLYGKLSLEQILSRAQRKRLKTIAICDNNTVLGHILLDNIDTKRYFKGKIISGIEIDVFEEGLTFQILGYGFDVLKMNDFVKKYYGSIPARQTRIRKMLLERAKKHGFLFDPDFEWNAKTEYAHENVLRMLKEHSENKEKFGGEFPKDATEFYNLSCHISDYPFYIDMEDYLPSLDEAVEKIHELGGLVALSAPYKYRSGKVVDKILKCCKGKIDALEVYYPHNTKAQTARLEEYAKKHNLLTCGGSDFQDNERLNRLARLKPEKCTILTKL